MTTTGSLEELLDFRQHQKFPIDESYLKLVNLLMASAHCSKSAASLSLTPSDPMEATKEKLIGPNAQDLDSRVSNDSGFSSATVPFSSLKGKPVGSLSLTPSNPVKETKGKLVGSNTSDLGVGVSEDPGPSSSTVPLFSSLKKKPVGSQESILFWNKEQAQFLFQDNPRCIIKGDYGSGIKRIMFTLLYFFVTKILMVKFVKSSW